MKIIRQIRVLILLIILIPFNNIGWSQIVVERSKEKVIISGTPYYIHQVKKGETSYSISKAYGIAVEELIRENPPAVYGIREGQSLRIPVRSVTEAKPTVAVPGKILQKDESKFIYHILKPGETVYSLSKSYGVSENEIIQSNPGIDITKLTLGTEIAVPRRKFMSNQQKFDDQEKKYIYHKVTEGESLSSIARQYGLTLRALRRENRDMRFPQVGDYVRIPGVKSSETEPAELNVTDTVTVAAEVPPVRFNRPSGYTEVRNLSGQLNVAVLLPFYLKENSERIEIDSSTLIKGKKQYKVNRKPEEWIDLRSLDFVEMYEGILLAADTLRSLGLNIKINTFDIDNDSTEVTNLISSGKLSGMDLIIGPVYSHNLSIVAGYAKGLGIPVVSPVALMNNSVLNNNPTLFLTNSSIEIAQKAIAKTIAENYDNNLVFIYSDSLGTDMDVKRFKNLIFNELSYKIPYEDIKFKEFQFFSRSMFDNDSINRLSHALSEKSRNIVIIASEDAPLISETISDIHGLSKKFDVRVFGYPSLLDIENLPPKLFFDLDMMIFTPFWIDYAKPNVKKFNSRFRQIFLTEPLEKSYSWLGYDIAYYFFSGLAINGKDFIAHPEMHNPELLQTKFDFERKTANDGFENQKLILIRYTKDYEVKKVDEDSLFVQK
jgi:LysM repeat protein